jgi:hypothetical protein
MRTRWWWVLAAVALAAAGCSSDDDAVPALTTTTTAAVTSTSTTAVSTTSSTSTSTSTSTSSTSTTIAGPPPAPVTAVTVAPGGGSGELEVSWDPVAGATGYRVERADDASGPFAMVADIDVVAGTAGVAAGVVNVFTQEHSFHPPSGPPPPPGSTARFHLVDLREPPAHYRVVATNASGAAAPSETVCAC